MTDTEIGEAMAVRDDMTDPRAYALVAKMLNEIIERQRDAALAARDLPVSIPEPGTDAARLLIANRMLKNRLAESETRELRFLQEIDEKEAEVKRLKFALDAALTTLKETR